MITPAPNSLRITAPVEQHADHLEFLRWAQRQLLLKAHQAHRQLGPIQFRKTSAERSAEASLR